ncbi:MAG: hypothetical protein RIM84_20875 [Alphaproteobacteria bacterium]
MSRQPDNAALKEMASTAAAASASHPPMSRPRILFVSGFFPPYSPLGAVRAPELAAHWQSNGHDVRVIAVKDPAIEGMLDLPLAPDQVTYVPYAPDTTLMQRLTGSRGRSSELATAGTAPATPAKTPKPGQRDRLRWLRQFYRQAEQFPDRHWSWIDPAVDAGRRLGADWRPDLVYSSAPPHSGHIVAQRIAEHLNLPWVAELRDPWAINAHDDVHPLIKPWRKRIALNTLAHATACVAVSATLASFTRTIVSCPTIVSYNGFGADDFPEGNTPAPFDPERLTLIHAGAIYAERRDPTPLFRALATMGEDHDKVRVQFFHDQRDWVQDKAREFGVEACLEMCQPVPRKQILARQREVDVLLMCRWDDPGGDGIIPGKLFEYIGARRPILSIGSTTGEAADVIRDGDFGLVANDTDVIANQLRAWLEQKCANGGRLPDMPAAPTTAFLRDTQFEQIDALIAQVLARA